MTGSVLEDRRPSAGRFVGFVVLLSAVSWGLGALAAAPWQATEPDSAVVRIAFKHVAAFEHGAAARSEAELEKLPRHMRPTSPDGARTGRRVDTLLRVEVDGQTLLIRRYAPGGLRGDGPTFAYEELAIRPGPHLLEVTLADDGPAHGESANRRQWHLRERLEVTRRDAPLVEFSEDAGLMLRPTAAGKRAER